FADLHCVSPNLPFALQPDTTISGHSCVLGSALSVISAAIAWLRQGKNLMLDIRGRTVGVDHPKPKFNPRHYPIARRL
ncbi:hypothetical protein NKH56_36130, partial [Mesorhizobium sp. M1076]|uniref:hypothetical protein n=1 Tax=Mesorhizobium sp. M1076 TaxID=2957054 RepID=UPI003335078B